MVTTIELRSDNAVGAAPEILAAMAAANTRSALPYGGDEWTSRLRERVREVFEHPNAEVFPVSSGTAANALSLASLCPPWGAVLCHESAHILRSECAATSMFSGGGAICGLPGEAFRLTPEALDAAFDATRWGDPHQSQPSVVSLTLPTDYGTIYTVAQVAALAERGRSRGLRVHVDGARIANAIDALGCKPADLTWRAGVDVLSLGATKNGAVSTDAIVCFDSAVSEQLVYRVKRAGHVPSKMRFQSVQLDTYLTDGLWLRLARQANITMARLAAGLTRLGIQALAPAAVNIVFVLVDDDTAQRMGESGLLFYGMGPQIIRFVTSFLTTDAEIDLTLERIEKALS